MAVKLWKWNSFWCGWHFKWNLKSNQNRREKQKHRQTNRAPRCCPNCSIKKRMQFHGVNQADAGKCIFRSQKKLNFILKLCHKDMAKGKGTGMMRGDERKCLAVFLGENEWKWLPQATAKDNNAKLWLCQGVLPTSGKTGEKQRRRCRRGSKDSG